MYQNNMNSKRTALGVDVFGGGFTLGVLRAGYRVLGQWEECDAGAKTFDVNFHGIPRPLRRSDWDVLALPDRVDLVYCNPPCAVWSTASRRGAGRAALGLDDPRLQMTERAMDVGLAVKPDTFVLESVTNAWRNGGAYYSAWAEKWIAEGYGVTFFLTDAILHGLASERRRFHFIAHRRELGLAPPDMKRFIPRTTRHAIGDLMDVFDKRAQHVPQGVHPSIVELMRNTPPGGKPILVANEMIARGHERFKPMPSFFWRRLHWDSPALTVMGMEVMVHPERDRFITIREGLRLLGYPDDFRIDNDRVSNDAPVQAVLPVMGEYLARVALESMDRPRAARDLEVVDWLDLAVPYRQTAVVKAEKENQ